MPASLPAPVPDTPNYHKWTDADVGAEYIEFPEDTVFMESAAMNAAYKPGVAYIPCQRVLPTDDGDTVLESFVYSIDPANSKEATLVIGPLANPYGDKDVTIFGSALTSTGLLILCCFNRNSLLVYDLETVEQGDGMTPVSCELEIPDLPSPNDVCVDPKDETLLYVAGGSFRACVPLCCCVTFTNSAYGKVFSAKMDYENKVATVDEVAAGFDVLAGIEVVDNKLWVAQLYDVFTLNQDKSGVNGGQRTAWLGHDTQGSTWMADNVDVFDDDKILFPAYSTVPQSTAENVMTRNFLVSAFLFYTQISTAWIRGEKLSEALLDPEVSLAFSNTYIDKDTPPQPVRIAIMDKDGSADKAYHFEIDLEQTRQNHAPREIKSQDGSKVLGKRHHFNEQVTHTGHLKTTDVEGNEVGYLLCINFEQPRVLLLKDDKFRKAMMG
mmetsp:Transcript_11371/g.32644  ORF Transcript_11371/g.32644 Transcript_11371/m.32644 type:complete len:439 (+) Transcript_11371:170-1486(+)